MKNKILLKSHIAFTIFFLIIIGVSQSCSKKEVPQTVHEDKAITKIKIYSENDSRLSGEDLIKLKTIDSKKISQDLFDLKLSKTNPAVFAIENIKILNKLSLFISTKFIEQFGEKELLRDILRNYNKAFSNIIGVNGQYPKLGNYLFNKDSGKSINLGNALIRFYNLFKYNCDGELRDCNSMIFFMQSSHTPDILLELVRRIDIELEKLYLSPHKNSRAISILLRSYYFIMHSIFATENYHIKAEVSEKFAKYAYEYEKEIAKEEMFIRKRHGRAFKRSISILSFEENINKFEGTVKKIIDKFGPCKYSEKSVNRPLPFGETELLILASKILSPKDSNDSRLAECFSVANIPKNDHVGKSFPEAIKELTKKNNSIISTLKLNSIKNNVGILEQNPVIYYIIDRVFRGHWQSGSAKKIIKNLKLKDFKILKLSNLYIKFELAKMISETKRVMKSIYNDPETFRDNIHDRAVNDNSEITNQWTNFHLGKNNLISFTKAIFNNELQTTDFKTHATIFKNIDKNIKYLVTYPHMYVLLYLMTRKDSSKTENTFFGTSTKTPAEIVTDFLNGKESPWFKFTEKDLSPLSKSEMLYSFDFALKTNVFSIIKKSNADDAIIDFFNVLPNIFLTETIDELKQSHDKIKEETEVKHDAFFRMCRDPKKADYSLNFKKLKTRLLLGKNDKVTSLYTGYKGQQKPITVLTSIRKNVISQTEYIKLMIEIYEKHMNKEIGSISEIRTDTDLIDNYTKKIYTYIASNHHQINDCLYKVNNMEFELQREFIKEELEHGKDIFEKITKLNEISNKKLRKEEAKKETIAINKESNDSVYEGRLTKTDDSDHELFSSITEHRYNSSPFNLYARMKNFIEAQNIIYEREGKDYVQVKVTTSSINLTDIYKSSRKNEDLNNIEYIDKSSLPEFLYSLMIPFRSPENFIVNWFGVDYSVNDIGYLSEKIDMLIELYFANINTFYSKKKGLCLNTSSPCTNSNEITAKKLIEEVLRVAKHVSLSKDDIEILDIIGLKRKINNKKMRKLFLDENGNHLTLFEKTFTKLEKFNTFKNEAYDFYQDTESSDQNFIFPPNPETKKILSKKYKDYANNYFSAITKIFKELDAIEKDSFNKKEDERIKLIYEIEQDSNIRNAIYLGKKHDDKREHLEVTIVEKNNRRIFLNRDKIEDFNNKMNTFHNKNTGTFFLKK